MRNLPTAVVSNTLRDPLDWRDATVMGGDSADIVTRPRQPPLGDDLPCHYRRLGSRPHLHGRGKTMTSSCSRATPSTATSKSSPTDPPATDHEELLPPAVVVERDRL